MIPSHFEDVDLWGACTFVVHRPGRWRRLGQTGSVFAEARSVIRRDPEILAFSGLQILWIALSYGAWAWSYSWNPWLSLDVVEGLWVSVWVMATGVPIRLLTLAMCSSVVQRSRGMDSTFWSCLRVAGSRFWSAGLFQAVDAWITLKRISQRAGERGGSSRSILGTFLDEVPDIAWEFLYQGWKSATLGVIPALAAGKPLGDAVESSVGLLRARPEEVLVLRLSYSLACWLVAIPTVMVGAKLYLNDPMVFVGGQLNPAWLYRLGWLVLVALLVIHLVVRPLFLVCSTSLWIDWNRSAQDQSAS